MDELNIVSTGDPKKDAEIIARSTRIERQIAEGLCPNDQTPLRAVDIHTLECPKCGFISYTLRPHGFKVE